MGPLHPDDARAYLYTVAANLGVDRQRRVQWLQRHLSQRLACEDGANLVPDVADGVMYRQALDSVDAALAALPARMREVFLAHRVHGERQIDIAARMGVSLNTVERNLTGAHDRVEAALRRWRGDATRGGAGIGKGRRKSLTSLLGLTIVGVMGATAGWRYWQTQALHWQAAFATPHGRRLTQKLHDGSTLTLDAQSRVELAYDARHRSVHLREGAAFFAVIGDVTRPFVVNAGEVTVTVLGTRFGVELAPTGAVMVQVEAGSVRVSRAGHVLAEALTAGQGLQVPTEGSARALNSPAAPWREGRVHFDAAPLSEVVLRLSRYALFGLRTDSKVAQLRVSGTVEVARMSEWLQALPAALPVRVLYEAGGGVLLVAR
jgi:ferric-dicitrate binding protein FerR (iron transport regulator)